MAGRDIIVVAVTFFVVALLLFIVSYVGQTMYDNTVNKPVINESSTTVAALGGIPEVIDRFDYMAMGIFIALSIGVIITGWFIPAHPIFMLAYILLTLIATVISAILANTWESITAFSSFAATLSTFPIANHLVLNLPLYVAVVGFIGIIVIFGKPFLVGEPQ